MKYKGYSGKILHVDLTKRSVETRRFTEKFCEDYIGGVGFAAKIIADGVQNWQKPLDEGNPLIFMTGPLTGTIIPWSGRHCPKFRYPARTLHLAKTQIRSDGKPSATN